MARSYHPNSRFTDEQYTARMDGDFYTPDEQIALDAKIAALRAAGRAHLDVPALEVQEPPQDERIFNRRLPDGTFRPLSEFFAVAAGEPEVANALEVVKASLTEVRLERIIKLSALAGPENRKRNEMEKGAHLAAVLLSKQVVWHLPV